MRQIILIISATDHLSSFKYNLKDHALCYGSRCRTDLQCNILITSAIRCLLSSEYDLKHDASCHRRYWPEDHVLLKAIHWFTKRSPATKGESSQYSVRTAHPVAVSPRMTMPSNPIVRFVKRCLQPRRRRGENFFAGRPFQTSL